MPPQFFICDRKIALHDEQLAADKGAPEAVATTKDPMPVGVFTARLA